MCLLFNHTLFSLANFVAAGYRLSLKLHVIYSEHLIEATQEGFSEYEVGAFGERDKDHWRFYAFSGLIYSLHYPGNILLAHPAGVGEVEIWEEVVEG